MISKRLIPLNCKYDIIIRLYSNILVNKHFSISLEGMLIIIPHFNKIMILNSIYSPMVLLGPI